MQYRLGYDNGTLRLDELTIEYSHIGGQMCYDKSLQLPELKCAECGRNLQLLIQYVSQCSTDSLHRLIYVLICNSKHYKTSIRCITYNKTVVAPERDTSNTVETKPSDTWQDDIEPASLLQMTEGMGKQVVKENTKEKVHVYDKSLIQYCVRKQNSVFEPHDIRTEPVDDGIKEFQEGTVEAFDQSMGFTDCFLQQFKGSCIAIGYDRPAVCYQKCIDKMQQYQFDEDKYVSKQVLSDNDESVDEDKVGNEVQLVEEVIVEEEVQQAVDCDCNKCKLFKQQYVHEFDIFSTILWVLKMHEVENGAEMKALYVYGARTEIEGFSEGTVICQDDKDDIELLKKEIHQK